MPRKATFKQKAFVHEYIKHGNGSKAARKVYKSRTSQAAGQMALKTLKSPQVIKYMEKVMDEVGLSDDKLVNHLKQIIDISLAKEAMSKATPSDALRGIEMAFRLRDRFPAQRTQLEKKEVSIKLEGKSPTELYDTLDKVTQELSSFKRLLRGKTEEAQVVK